MGGVRARNRPRRVWGHRQVRPASSRSSVPTKPLAVCDDCLDAARPRGDGPCPSASPHACAPLTACPNVCVLADPKRLKTARRGDLVNGKRRLALVSFVVLACCKTPAPPESQPPATAPASDAHGSASPRVAQQPAEHEDLPHRLRMRYAELATDDPLLSASTEGFSVFCGPPLVGSERWASFLRREPAPR